MDETLKLIRDMIENDGSIVYGGYCLFKSAHEDKGFCIGKIENPAAHFTPLRYFGFNIVEAVQYLYENGGKE
jgi:hypothetical protein